MGEGISRMMYKGTILGERERADEEATEPHTHTRTASASTRKEWSAGVHAWCGQ